MVYCDGYTVPVPFFSVIRHQCQSFFSLVCDALGLFLHDAGATFSYARYTVRVPDFAFFFVHVFLLLYSTPVLQIL